MSNLVWQLLFSLTTLLAIFAAAVHAVSYEELGRIAWSRWSQEYRSARSRTFGIARRYGLITLLAAALALPSRDPVWAGLVAGAVFFVIAATAVASWTRIQARTVEDVAATISESAWADAIRLSRREAFRLGFRTMRLRAWRQLLLIAISVVAAELIVGRAIDAGRSPDGSTGAALFGIACCYLVACLSVVLVLDWIDPQAALADRVLAAKESSRWEAADRWLTSPWEEAAEPRGERERIRSAMPLISLHLRRKADAQPGGFTAGALEVRTTLLRDLVLSLEDGRDYQRAWHAVLQAVIRPGLPANGVPEGWSPPGFSRSLERLRVAVPPMLVYASAVIGLIVSLKGLGLTMSPFDLAHRLGW